MREALRLSDAKGSAGVREHVRPMLGWLGMPPPLRVAHWDDWICGLLRKDGTPREVSCFAANRLAALHPEIHAIMREEQARVMAVEDCRRAVRMADATRALLLLAFPMLRAYTQRKQELGYLDYADLIGRTSDLLTDPGAAWVLYKLDGGIDHLLLDEVQDTAPEQWQIAHRLTEEFFAGLGARVADGAPDRTFFAVGDPKQSIYSFQGADPLEFLRSRAEVAYRVKGSEKEWRDVTLDVSFRSTVPVLSLVDAVFSDPAAAGGVVDGKGLHHFPERAGDAGRVELWPLTPVPDAPETPPWTVPPTNLGLVSAPQRLADTVATWIAEEIRRGVGLPSRGRVLTAGDVLVLVRRRTDFARNLVRALKAKGVPVAGLDRLELTEQLAVQDLLAACDAVLLPEDDLQVACVLTSPLGGLSDESLMELALGRSGTLWNALRDRAAEREDWLQAWNFLSALAARADHVTPHALLAEALGPLGGRARLLARLGPEAAEPVDELLNAALDYTRLHAPSLQGFVHWLRRSGATVKREAGGSGGAVRVMTVHGAKGLQAPLVLLPDTTGLPPEDEKFAWTTDAVTGADVPLWAPRREFRCAPIDRARVVDRARQMQEHNRLLYVALTRAEDRLVICGWQTRRGVPETSWYSLVARGFAAIGASSAPFGLGWDGDVLSLESAQTGPVRLDRRVQLAPKATLPAWAGRAGDWRPAPPPAEPAIPRPLAPSRPDGAALGPVPRTRSPLAAAGRRDRFLRGTLVHELLQHLPALPSPGWERAAKAHLARHGLEPAEVGRLAEQTLTVLHHPDLARLFGPEGRAEQSIAGLVDGVAVSGKVDRMAVLPEAVLLADYKTGRDAPNTVEDTPVLYLRQLAAYRAVLGAIYPDRPVRCALVWTAGPVVTSIPSALLDAHAPGA
ncbi:MAG: UvrD-helicase domain-containing protein [Acetobacteraceae bacterium]|nr:UvrD-helicase domain-containing protein [Acetobacteraceae bacterium]